MVRIAFARILTCLTFLPFVGIVHGQSSPHPIVPGLDARHPLDQVGIGQVLVGELRCASCHDGISPEGMKPAPDLTEVGSRLEPEFLKKFLANPHGVQPGTTMPDVLSGLPPDEKQKVAESLSHYLSSLESDEMEKISRDEITDEITDEIRKSGDDLYHSIGCVVCHPAQDQNAKKKGKRLSHLAGKYQPGELARFLLDPLKVRPGGRMPNMHLTKIEATSLAAFLADEKPAKTMASTPDQIAAGKEAFAKFNCQACHEVEGVEAQKGPSLEKMKLDQGCLSDAPSKAPNYHFVNDQRKAVRAALGKPISMAPQDRMHRQLTRLNCISCHVRDNFGGVSNELDPYFKTTEEALGNEARIPPPLTKIGAKLRPEWLNQVLYERKMVRPYMTTRMPHYGSEALAGLTDCFAEVDPKIDKDLPPPEREQRSMMRNAGHLLLGDKGLNCITCHNYNGKESPGMKGLDLMTSYQRLQPGWFHQFMLSPAAHRPGIIMPSYWPDGTAVKTDLLEGDTEMQLQSLWHQFSLGRSARDPSGLKSEPTKLVVTDKVRVYRGRSRVAGYRGIAVGFPGGLSYAFDAQNGALAAIWSGEFVSVNWRSQGAGDFNPIGRPVQLSPDVAFLKLKDESEKWPLRPVKTKEEPVNPDPAYPKNRGYSFRGYYFDQVGNPTIMYRCEDVEIEESSTVILGEDPPSTIRRNFSFKSSGEDILHFRVLSGAIKDEGGGVYSIDRLKIKIGSKETILRKFGPENQSELLIKIPLKNGQTTYSIDYEIQR